MNFLKTFADEFLKIGVLYYALATIYICLRDINLLFLQAFGVLCTKYKIKSDLLYKLIFTLYMLDSYRLEDCPKLTQFDTYCEVDDLPLLEESFADIHRLVLFLLFITVVCGVSVTLDSTKNDGPMEWQTYLNDPATTSMEGILSFNSHLTFLLILIVIFVGWLLYYTIFNFAEFNNKYNSKFVHSKELEIVWTSVPALILLILSTPSFTLLYSMDEISESELSLKILGHQWYWSYEMSDFNSCQKKEQSIKYVCYMMVLDGLPKNKQGYFRLLETNRRVILPMNSHLRLLVSAADVLHSWTVPSFGLKVDACPGRLNQLNLFIKRVGVFYGQCSEICGVNHGFMPIVILSFPTSEFYTYLMTKLEFN